MYPLTKDLKTEFPSLGQYVGVRRAGQSAEQHASVSSHVGHVVQIEGVLPLDYPARFDPIAVHGAPQIHVQTINRKQDACSKIHDLQCNAINVSTFTILATR